MMKKIGGLVLRRLGNEAVVVAESLELVDFDRVVSLNASAVYVWESLPDAGFNVEAIAKLLTERYDVDEATALTDARELVEVWLQAGVVEKL